ncbi:MAG: hypothetical protein ACRDU4_04665 [Mycobacterium sp.]
MLRAANDVKPLSVDMEAIGARLEVRMAEIDCLLRSAWSLARDHGGPEIAESVRNSIATAEVMSVAPQGDSPDEEGGHFVPIGYIDHAVVALDHGRLEVEPSRLASYEPPDRVK